MDSLIAQALDQFSKGRRAEAFQKVLRRDCGDVRDGDRTRHVDAGLDVDEEAPGDVAPRHRLHHLSHNGVDVRAGLDAAPQFNGDRVPDPGREVVRPDREIGVLRVPSAGGDARHRTFPEGAADDVLEHEFADVVPLRSQKSQ